MDKTRCQRRDSTAAYTDTATRHYLCLYIAPRAACRDAFFLDEKYSFRCHSTRALLQYNILFYRKRYWRRLATFSQSRSSLIWASRIGDRGSKRCFCDFDDCDILRFLRERPQLMHRHSQPGSIITWRRFLASSHIYIKPHLLVSPHLPSVMSASINFDFLANKHFSL